VISWAPLMQVWPRQVVLAQSWVAAGIGVASATVAVLATAVVWAAAVGPALGLWWWHTALGKFRRRRALTAAPFPEAWRAVLARRVAFYRRLSPAGQARFETDVAIFLAEQHIVGPQESAVPEDMCVLIASAAAMLGHGRPAWEWPTHRDIIVHVTNFNEDYEPGDHHGIAGMVHAQGPVLLSRKQVRHGFKKTTDGINVAVHELAHVIDLADGAADGHASIWGELPGWQALVQARLKQVRRGGKQAPLRAYAGTNEAELFAVAVEAFFETPDRLQRRDPQLYKQLEVLFNLDPTTGELRAPG
jgi:Mlc titration factor MtfA (ptsG expression regulator)